MVPFVILGTMKNEKCVLTVTKEFVLEISTAKMQISLQISLRAHIQFQYQDESLTNLIIQGHTITAAEKDLIKLRQCLGGKITFLKILNFYSLERQIGEGTFSSICKVISHDTKIAYAVKCVKKHTLQASEIHHEINIQTRLSHPNIAKIYEVYESTNTIYIIMELLDRHLTYDYDHEESKLILHQILLGLNHLHINGIMHRDLKLENIMFDMDNQIKIIDFGLAIEVNSKNQLCSCGTPGYAGPEVLNCKHYNEKCDLFSLGSIMYQLYFKEPLFKEEGVHELINHNKRFSLMQLKNLPISDDGFNLLCGLLQPNPKYRLNCQNALKHPYFNSIYEGQTLIPLPQFDVKFKESLTNYRGDSPTASHQYKRPFQSQQELMKNYKHL